MRSASLPAGTLRAARIPYLNTEPFLIGWDAEGISLRAATPRRLGEWAAAGELDAGPLSLVDLWRLEPEFEPLDDFGIAAKRAARSVLLFSRRPVAELEGASIGVTDQTSTSVRLLEVLLKFRHGVKPVLRAGFQASDDARLLIGDDALAAGAKGLEGFPQMLDLGTEWRAWQGMPFVFARWAVRRTVPPYLKQELASQLDRSLKLFEKRRGALASESARRLNLPADAVRSYWRGFSYRFGPAELAGEKAFRDLLTGKARGCGC